MKHLTNTQIRKAREHKKYLVQLTDVVDAHLNKIDLIMKEPESNIRGQEIAKLCNILNMANDCAKHFGLDIPFEKFQNRKDK